MCLHPSRYYGQAACDNIHATSRQGVRPAFPAKDSPRDGKAGRDAVASAADRRRKSGGSLPSCLILWFEFHVLTLKF